jgi:hypothetical protein
MNEESTQDSLRERVLTSITEHGITPKPTWHFLLHESVVWLVACSALVVGSVASALTIYIASASRFMVHTIQFSSLEGLFEMVPLLWLMLFSCAVFYAIHAMRDTRRGYRLPITWLVVGAVGVSMGMGYVLYRMGVGILLDQYLLQTAPYYQPITGYHPHHWMRPQEGVLAGTVTEVEGDMYSIRSLDGIEWKVRYATSSAAHCPLITQGVKPGMRVRVVGTSTQEGVYEAIEVCEFRGRGSIPRQVHMVP